MFDKVLKRICLMYFYNINNYKFTLHQKKIKYQKSLEWGIFLPVFCPTALTAVRRAF